MDFVKFHQVKIPEDEPVKAFEEQTIFRNLPDIEEGEYDEDERYEDHVRNLGPIYGTNIDSELWQDCLIC